MKKKIKINNKDYIIKTRDETLPRNKIVPDKTKYSRKEKYKESL